MNESTIVYISDGTAITIKAVGDSLISQFPDISFKHKIYPYIDNTDKALAILTEIQQLAKTETVLIFSSLVEQQVRDVFSSLPHFDLFNEFLPKLSQLFDKKPRLAAHKMHSMADQSQYTDRIAAIDYALQTDDGLGSKRYQEAEIILIGASRTGKTPTSLYLALNYGISVANFPFAEEDFNGQLPKTLQPHKAKLFGLTIHPKRLNEIRQARRSNSRYAELAQCQKEIDYMESLYQQLNIPFLDTSSRSIEEIATLIVTQLGLLDH